MRNYKLNTIFFIFFISVPTILFAHHGSATGGAGITGADGKRIKPTGQIQYSVEYTKQPEDSRNTWTGTLYGEIPIGETPVSFFASVPWHYYEQSKQKDSSRYGKPRIGSRISAFNDLMDDFTLVADLSLGLPTGADTDIFTSENYWDGGIGLSLGYSMGPLFLAGRVGGIFPLTKLEPVKTDDPAYFSYNETASSLAKVADEEQLKPVTEASASLSVRIFWGLSLYAGYSYRTPHDGIVWTDTGTPPSPVLSYLRGESLRDYAIELYTDSEIQRPNFYEEYSLGLNIIPVDRLILSLSYKIPGFQRPGVRPFESSVLASVTWQFGSLKYDYDD